MSQQIPLALLLDEDCGERARRLSELSHVWVVNSEPNVKVARSHWQARRATPNDVAQGSLTTFQPRGGTPENWVASVIDTIEDHHNQTSSLGSYNTLIVEGAELTMALRQLLQHIGFTCFKPHHCGFSAVKSVA